MHISPNVRSCFIQTYNGCFGSETDLFFEEILQFLVTDTLISISINPSNKRHQFTLLEVQPICPEEALKINAVNTPIISSVDTSINA